jgi:hypothetical protein
MVDSLAHKWEMQTTDFRRLGGSLVPLQAYAIQVRVLLEKKQK